MKKLIYISTLLIALVLMNTSCEKSEDDTPDVIKTLEQTFPDWKNLVWVSTDGKDATTIPAIYPRLSIKIAGNNITVNQPTSATQSYTGILTAITITASTITFNNPIDNSISSITGTYTKTGTQITYTTKGLSTTSHVYILQIN